MTQKVVVSGSVVEVYSYENPIPYGFTRSKAAGRKSGVADDAEKEEQRNNSIYRAKRGVRRLITANIGTWTYGRGKTCRPLMLTLTFAENVTDLTEAHYEFMLFIQRLNDRCFGADKSQLKYVMVTEFQGRGAVHYHVILFNLPYLKNVQAEIKDIWGKGIVFISTIKSPLSAARYLTKYLTKDTADARLRGRKRYTASRGIHQSIVVNDDHSIATILATIPAKLKIFEKQLHHKQCGNIVYSCFVLPEDRDLATHLSQIIKATQRELVALNKQADHVKIPPPTDAPDVEDEAFPSIAL